MNRTATIVALLALSAAPTLAHGPEKHEPKPAAAGGHAEALGEPGDPKARARTIVVTMNDEMRFNPNRFIVAKGETIRFEVRNTGKIKHEMVLGTIAELKEHAALMQKFPEMEHDDPNAVGVEPGKTGLLLWRFTKAGEFDFGCLVPGHFEANMKGKITVK
ncbi:cupredoxin domain-containing protein [Desertibaculum subflavum]|uniref:cupredoxin domain-containing protein n=1 Tax=Desertibaculum subflavum TaxID=2268458 RepID=UPI000E6727D7